MRKKLIDLVELTQACLIKYKAWTIKFDPKLKVDL